MTDRTPRAPFVVLVAGLVALVGGVTVGPSLLAPMANAVGSSASTHGPVAASHPATRP